MFFNYIFTLRDAEGEARFRLRCRDENGILPIQLFRDEKNVPIRPAELKLLRVLLQNQCNNPGEAVGKDELINEVWGAEFGATEDRLRGVINRLRHEVFREVCAAETSCIQTFSKRGYSFEPMVRKVDEVPDRVLTSSVSQGGHAMEPYQGLIEWVHQRLSNVSYHAIHPVNIRVSPLNIQSEITDEPFFIGPPDDVEAIIMEALTRARNTAAASDPDRRSECENIIHNCFREPVEDLSLYGLTYRPTEDVDPSDDLGSDRFKVFNALRSNKKYQGAKRRALMDYLLAKLISKEAGCGFWFNGPQFVISQLRFGLDETEREKVQLLCQPTDYYSWRVIRYATEYVLDAPIFPPPRTRLRDRLCAPSGFNDYLAGDFQFVHMGLGIQVVVCTNDKRHKRLVIRKRSRHISNDEDAGKLVVSVNEGLKSPDDVSPGGPPRQFNDFTAIINRALEEELFARPPRELAELQLFEKIEKYELIGGLAYLPNLSVNLVFLVTVNASLEHVFEAAKYVKEGRPEFEPDDPNRCPEFNVLDIERFLRSTITTQAANDTWDEGCLAGLMCCLPALSS